MFDDFIKIFQPNTKTTITRKSEDEVLQITTQYERKVDPETENVCRLRAQLEQYDIDLTSARSNIEKCLQVAALCKQKGDNASALQCLRRRDEFQAKVQRLEEMRRKVALSYSEAERIRELRDLNRLMTETQRINQQAMSELDTFDIQENVSIPSQQNSRQISLVSSRLLGEPVDTSERDEQLAKELAQLGLQPSPEYSIGTPDPLLYTLPTVINRPQVVTNRLTPQQQHRQKVDDFMKAL
jgi:NACalpha-BTF3-like transcription factor